MRRTIARFTLLAALAVGASGCGLGAAPSTDEGTSTQGAGAPAENDGTEPAEGSSGGETEAGGPSDGGGDESAAENQAFDEGEDEQTSGPDGAGVLAMEETVAESSIDLDGSTLSFELKGVTANDSAAVAHGVIVNTGAHGITLETTLHDNSLIPEHIPRVGSNSQINVLTITDTTTGNLHTPAYSSEGHCLCTERPYELESGESLRVSAQYAPLPQDATAVTVNFGPMGSFENVPVTRS